MGNRFDFNTARQISDEPVYLHLDISAEQAYTLFANIRPQVMLRPTEANAGVQTAEDDARVPFLPSYAAPGEASSEKIFFIDFSSLCTMGFADEVPGDGKGGWSDEGPFNDMRNFPIGNQRFFGVPFKIIDPKTGNGRTVITLYSPRTTPGMPKNALIPVNKDNLRVLYFLHAAAWGSPGNIGDYTIRYNDGSEEKIYIMIPDNNNNWWNGHNSKEISKPVSVRVTNTSTGKPAWRYVRILEWENKKRDVPVKEVLFSSAGGNQVPILIAVTAIQW